MSINPKILEMIFDLFLIKAGEEKRVCVLHTWSHVPSVHVIVIMLSVYE